MAMTEEELKQLAADKMAESLASFVSGIPLVGFLFNMVGMGKSFFEEKVKGLMADHPDFFVSIRPYLDKLNGMTESFKNTVLGTADKDALVAKNNMYAAIGYNEMSELSGQNPFASLDKMLGIEVAAKVQAEVFKAINTDLIKPIGISQDPVVAGAAAKAAAEAIQPIIYDALLTKYGKTAADEERIQTQSELITASITGIDKKLLEANNFDHWITTTPPTSGVAAFLLQSQKKENPSFDLNMDFNIAKMAVAAIKTPKSPAVAENDNQLVPPLPTPGKAPENGKTVRQHG